MLLKFTGDDRQEVSFITGNYYKARKIHDEFGEAWAIFDEGYDWYRYGVNFVAENFDGLRVQSECLWRGDNRAGLRDRPA